MLLQDYTIEVNLERLRNRALRGKRPQLDASSRSVSKA